MSTAIAQPIKPSDEVVKIAGVTCTCGFRICDDDGIIRSRCIKLIEKEALCRCKRWVKVPIKHA